MSKLLFKVAKELNVGTNTIVEHLNKKGYDIDNKPNAKVTDDMFTELIKQFQVSVAEKEKADRIVIGSRPMQQQPQPKKEIPVSIIKRKRNKPELGILNSSIPPPPIPRNDYDVQGQKFDFNELFFDPSRGQLKSLRKIDTNKLVRSERIIYKKIEECYEIILNEYDIRKHKFGSKEQKAMIRDIEALLSRNNHENKDVITTFTNAVFFDVKEKGFKTLDLANLGLRELPSQIFDNVFEEINFEGNLLSFLINSRNLHNLKRLNVAFNNLSEVPMHIPSLEYLDINNNQIKSISTNIEYLTNLKHLNISGNKLKELPISIRLIQNNLKTFNIQENEFNIPLEIIESTPDKIIEFILQIQEEKGGTALKEAKLIFVGFGEVGKTSLVKKILGEPFNSNEDKTVGIKISKWKVDDTRLNIWDFGGQEIMHSTHKFFMTNRSIYVVVINPRIDDKNGVSEDLEYWLKLIKSYAGNKVPIIIVQNKTDKHTNDLGFGSLQDKYPNLINFANTSCETGKGIEHFKSQIKAAVKKLTHLNDVIPPSYLEIKTQLEKNNNDYIEYKDYEKLCETINPNFSSKNKETLISLLHDLGVMLNFSQNRKLQDTQVLNPEWVTTGVYQIVTSELLSEKKGVISLGQLKSVLNRKLYRTDKERSYIIDMMEHFELCYDAENQRNTYYVPGVFKKDKNQHINNEIKQNRKKQRLEYKYKYDVLPSNIISKFIVKTNHLILSNFIWRNGVILEWENCKAVIEANSDKEIILQIFGDGDKRTFLGILREKFDLINSAFGGIKIQRVVPHSSNELTFDIDYDALLLCEKNEEKTWYIPQLHKHVIVKDLLDGIDNRKIEVEEIADIELSILTSLKILMLTANPAQTTKLNLDKEHSRISEKLQQKQEVFHLRVQKAINSSEFKEFTEKEKPNILHFSGHGESGKNGGIIVQNDDKNGEFFISPNGLSALFEYFDEEEIKLKAVILNACYSEEQAAAIAKYVPYVIGTTLEIGDTLAIAFSVGFYFKLSETEFDFEKAFKSGRTQAVLDGGQKTDFVLYKDGEKMNL